MRLVADVECRFTDCRRSSMIERKEVNPRLKQTQRLRAIVIRIALHDCNAFARATNRITPLPREEGRPHDFQAISPMREAQIDIGPQ